MGWFRDWSLITGRGDGGYKTGGGGGSRKVYPYKKGGGARKMLKGGHNSFGVVLTR